jgi:hypothetical protein
MKLRLLVLLILITGCGHAATAPSRVASEMVYVAGSHLSRPGVFGLEPATGRVAVEMPMAVPAADWKRLYAVNASRLQVFDPAGNEIAATDLPNGYQLPQTTFDGRAGGLSKNGRWLVLNHFQSPAPAAPAGTQPGVAQPPTRSSFLLVNTSTREIAHRVDLNGWYEFDGVDNAGHRLYLIHHFAEQPGKYEVAKYDFVTREMQSPIVEKTGKLRVMEGNRVSTLTDAGGHWQYSLYRGGREGAFIHSLNLDNDFATAWCVDLPGGGPAEQQLAWSISLSPDGKRLYAVNSMLNKVVWYNVAAISPGQPPTLYRQATFSSSAGFHLPFVTDAEAKEAYGLGISALSPDQSRLVVGMSGGVVILDADHLNVVERWAGSHRFQSVAFSTDGASIYGLETGGLVRIDARTGRAGDPLTSAVNAVAILGVRAV